MEVDIFCHAWDFNTQPNCVSVGLDVPNLNVQQGEIKELFDVLRPKKSMVESRKEFKPISNQQPIIVPSFLSQFYGIMQASRLKKQYEIENDFQYDIVVKMRYDAYFKTPIEFTNDIDPWSMYCFHYGWDSTKNRGRVGDIFWYASSETYDIIADYYLNICHLDPRFYRDDNGQLLDIPPETVFYSYIKKNDIMFNMNHNWDIKLFRESKQLAYSEDLNGFEIW